MASLDLEQCTFNRAVFQWARITKRLHWREYKELLRDIIAIERRLIGCSSKESFLTFEAAKRIATNRRGHDGHRHRKAYRCGICGGFHIGDVQVGRRYRLRMKELARA